MLLLASDDFGFIEVLMREMRALLALEGAESAKALEIEMVKDRRGPKHLSKKVHVLSGPVRRPFLRAVSLIFTTLICMFEHCILSPKKGKKKKQLGGATVKNDWSSHLEVVESCGSDS